MITSTVLTISAARPGWPHAGCRALLEFKPSLANRCQRGGVRWHDFTDGRAPRGGGREGTHWRQPDRGAMHAGQWSQDFSDWLGAYLSGWHVAETGERGRPVRDGAGLVLPGASQGPIEPPVRSSAGLGDGSPRIDTAITTGDADRHCDAASALEFRQVSRLAVLPQGEAAR